ncbi:uncharacterized protein LOC104882931 [Beta vulgaris subsp. vulgaris]|uniref:uncharacterized protein LOC104882931 n=1 Tax=Beta vulgaris subsp. vulgaris TaxID=3555 RepID=UPI00053FEF80|nr:uncharacterized protein LOC104882931 [Beta vulgaris subsp. vulgaris]
MNVCSGWCFTHNLSCHENGRIIIGWCPNAFNVDIKAVNSQFIHCWVQPKTGAAGFDCTFVYGFNDQQSRSHLWSGLKQIHQGRVGAWLVLGDFNAISLSDDRIGGIVRRSELTPMLDCMNECQLSDIKATGRYYTWSNKQEGDHRVLSRIDRVLANQMWMDKYDSAEAHILPEGDFDHTPMLVCVYPDVSLKKPFRFYNYWCHYDELLVIVRKEWEMHVSGCVMYRVVQKLRNIKIAIRRMRNKGWTDAEIAVNSARSKMVAVQNAMHENPRDISYCNAEKEAQATYKQAQKMLNSMLQQQAKLKWLKCGDENSKVFYQALKARRRHNRIHAIHDMEGNWLTKKIQVE